MLNKLNPDALYLQLGALLSSSPDLRQPRLDGEAMQWLARAVALVTATGNLADIVDIRTSIQFLNDPIMGRDYEQQIMMAVHRALAWAELNSSDAIRGTFIGAGAAFDALAAVERIVSTALSDILLVDPYADATILTDFAVLAPEGIPVRVLADEKAAKPGLKPAYERWLMQHPDRPLAIRLASKGSIHDRLVGIDKATAYSVGQSFNGLAKRAPTTLIRADSETAKLKIAAHEALWENASPLLADG